MSCTCGKEITDEQKASIIAMARNEKQFKEDRHHDFCVAALYRAIGALNARKVIEADYWGHGRDDYLWQSRQLVKHIENALRNAGELETMEDG